MEIKKVKSGAQCRTMVLINLKLKLLLQIIILNMKKIKIPVKKKRTNRENLNKYNFESPYKPKKAVKFIFYGLVIILPVALALYYLRFAVRQNQALSFPLDDPWIHLTFARNLAHFFSFSYFKNEMVTAGSTSPLYTFILSLFFLIKNDEMRWL